ncbi:MAG: hypothetical protein B6245_12035 [Desulfobacteraceae bacterium 4572_88]|nr:MAG: hypothetical protein B6245_12035 [Desulfobacteraceae bacterium 4572_88]
MKFTRIFRTLFTAVCLTLLFSKPVIGSAFSIKPEIEGTTGLDTNFYKAETQEREVYTYNIKPGIRLGYETGKSSLSLNYWLNAFYYKDKGDVPDGQRKADDDDYVGHTGFFSARTQPYRRLILRLDDSYHKTRDASQADRFSNSVEREKYVINRLTPMIFYEFENRFSLGLRYHYMVTDYARDDAEDSVEHRGTLDLLYHFTRTLNLDLQYQHWNRDYDRISSDYTSDQFDLILRKQFKYFSFEAGGGYHTRSFEKESLDDMDMFVCKFVIRGQNPPAPESSPRSHILFSVEQNFNDSGSGDDYFETFRIRLRAGHTFMKKILTNAECSYKKNDYETRTGLIQLREDDIYGLSVGAGYKFNEWLTFTIGTGYEKRDSNLAGYSYDNTYVKAGINFYYDLSGRQR